jgi:uncharacterized protein YbjQ (UPF0145 family)
MRVKMIVTALILTLSIGAVHARDTVLKLSIQNVLDSANYKNIIGDKVKFYFGNQPVPQDIKLMGEFVTNKKTNAFNKSDSAACQWVMLSALKQLQERALFEGGNAVVGIISYYKRNEFSSTSEYECHAGALMAGVAFKGTVAKISR